MIHIDALNNIHILPQLILLQADPSADPNLNMFSMELLEATTNITFAGDIPEIVDLLRDTIELLSGDSFEGNAESFEVCLP